MLRQIVVRHGLAKVLIANNPNATAHSGYFFVPFFELKTFRSSDVRSNEQKKSSREAMTVRTIKNLGASAVLLLTLGSAFSAEQKVANTNPAGTLEKPAVTASSPAVKKTVAAPKARLVDINSAGPNELKTLPGVTADVAEKIIAARPFGSKSQLTTRGIVPRELYEDLKGLVVAKQNPETTTKLLKK